MKINDRVKVKKLGNGTITKVLPHPIFPSWLISSNYLVLIDGKTEPIVVSKKEIV